MREKEEVGQGCNTENNTMVVYSLVYTTSVKSNMAEQKSIPFFNARLRATGFSSNMICLNFSHPTGFLIPQDSFIHETVHLSLHPFNNPPSGFYPITALIAIPNGL